MDKYLELKEKIQKAAKESLPELIALNDDLADNPEISGEEYESSRKIVELLKSKGFDTVYPFGGFDTAFKATYGPQNHKYKVAILTEYDALPEIGHACGHCVSGSMSVLAGLALKDVQDELDCDIHIVGTPIEETEGAKCTMVKHGVFDEYDMAMMIHLYDQNLLYCKLLALDSYLYTFHGKAAHGAAAPWEGINALNAAQLMMHAVDCYRQHVTPDVRMHAIYRNGGAAPNIVPEEASIEIYARSLSRPYLDKIVDRIDKMAEGACLMTGATWDRVPTAEPYDNLQNVETGLSAMKEVFGELGIEINGDHDVVFGSSDVGNVSFVCPTFHPTLQLVDRGIAIHTRDFEAAVKTEKAHNLIETGADVIALQVAKIFSDEERIKRLKDDFAKFKA